MTKVIYAPYSGAPTAQWPRGIESLIEYNGLVMNDRSRPEGIYIDRITGLDDPDIRDNRFPNPDRDGETVFDALYGGRTITLTGRIRAGNFTYMRYLWSNVKAAFASLTEHQLIFRYNDIKTNFSNPNWPVYYTLNSTANMAWTPTNSLVFTTTSQRNAVLSSTIRTYVDSEVQFTVNIGSALLGSHVAIIKGTDSSNYLGVTFSPSAGTIAIQKVVAGTPTTLATSSATTAVINTSYVLRGSIQGNVVTADLWPSTGPTDRGTPIISTTWTLAGGDITTYGTGKNGQPGWVITPGAADGTVSIDDFEAKSLNPGDYYVSCMKAAKLESEEVQDGTKVERNFMITLRASDPRMVSRKLHSLATTITSAGLTFPGGGGGFTFPSTAPLGLVFGQSMASITNLGNSKSYPIIRITGQATNPAVYNSTNGTITSVSGSIATGDYLEFDVFNRTVVDSLGTNKYSLLGSNNTWLSLESGANALSFGADAFSGTVVTVWYRHSSL